MHGEEQSVFQSLIMDDLKERVQNFAQQAIHNFPQYAKCLNLHVDYVER